MANKWRAIATFPGESSLTKVGDDPATLLREQANAFDQSKDETYGHPVGAFFMLMVEKVESDSEDQGYTDAVARPLGIAKMAHLAIGIVPLRKVPKVEKPA